MREDVWKIRQKAGMVFQNPDNQIIGNVVEEDVGFGPENLGVPTDEIWKRGGGEPYGDRDDFIPGPLSEISSRGGQKQRVELQE